LQFTLTFFCIIPKFTRQAIIFDKFFVDTPQCGININIDIKIENYYQETETRHFGFNHNKLKALQR